MNENLNLCEILKNCPYEAKLYCTFLGDVTFLCIIENRIQVRYGNATYSFSKYGTYTHDGECVLFPSKEQRDWSKFKVPIKRFDPKKFQPFDNILVRDGNGLAWIPSLFDRILKEPTDEGSVVELISEKIWEQCIPYNNETKELVGTGDDCPEYYKWWED